MNQEIGTPEYTIVAFIALIFIGGVVMVFKFMKAGKK